MPVRASATAAREEAAPQNTPLEADVPPAEAGLPATTGHSDAAPPAPRQQMEMSAPRKIAFDRSSGVEGDWDEDDISMPSLRVARGSGEQSADWTEGTVIIGEEEVLPPPNLKNPDPNHTLRFIPWRIRKRWREHVSEDEMKGGLRPRIVDTREEVKSLGGSVYKDDGARQWKRCADLYLLVECPKDNQHPQFALELDGKLYASVIYYARGTDFWGMAKDIFQTLDTVLNEVKTDPKTGEAILDDHGRPVRVPRVYKHVWEMVIKKVPSGNFMVYTPKVKLTRDKPGDEALAHIQNMLGV